jgi:formate dehydrogenase gamma subunit
MNREVKYIRMTKNERIQHFFLLSSFIVLVITGFGLKFPESWWVREIASVIGDNAFEARGLVHRIASIVLILVSVYHVIYIISIKRGRKLFKDFLPVKKDFSKFKDSILWLSGKKINKPLFGRFSYIEKMEYWAVVWGTLIMGVTGFILWFKDFFFPYISNTGMDIAEAIHYYEAILATLAIVVWHFYFVFINPDVAPMNKVWIQGSLSKEEMEIEHPLELEELENGNAETTETPSEKKLTPIGTDEIKSIDEGIEEEVDGKVKIKLNESLSKTEIREDLGSVEDKAGINENEVNEIDEKI